MQDQQGLAPVYALISRVLAREIDDELVSALSEAEVVDMLEPVATGLTAYLDGFDADAKEMADEEYCALFLLPGGVPPRAAAWMEGELETVGARISQVAQGYLERMGRKVAPGPWGKLPLDHASLLLHLASVDGDAQVVADLVSPWASSFGRALADRAQCPVYKAAGEVLCAL